MKNLNPGWKKAIGLIVAAAIFGCGYAEIDIPLIGGWGEMIGMGVAVVTGLIKGKDKAEA